MGPAGARIGSLNPSPTSCPRTKGGESSFSSWRLGEWGGGPPPCFQDGARAPGRVLSVQGQDYVVWELRASQHLSALLRNGSGVKTSSPNDPVGAASGVGCGKDPMETRGMGCKLSWLCQRPRPPSRPRGPRSGLGEQPLPVWPTSPHTQAGLSGRLQGSS